MQNAEHVILRELISHGDGFVSGALLAKKIGVSRVAVWQHMEKLRAQGFAFEAVRARGYRLAARPAGLHAALIEAHLKTLPKGFSLTVLDEVDSTNDEAARMLAAGADAPFAVFARRQHQGRGRLGRTWHSEANGNLYVSFGFRPGADPAGMATFTLWMGANLCELIANFTKLQPGLKWPNDILFEGGRKAGGMLTEARIDADQIRDLVFGLGLNLNSPAGKWPASLAKSATSLAEQAGGPLDLNHFAAALVGRVLRAYGQFLAGKHGEKFADLWNRFDMLRGKQIAVTQGTKRVSGTARGIDEAGGLLLRDAHGRSHRFSAGEATLEKGS